MTTDGVPDESVRPALVTLTKRDMAAMRDELIEGFPSREDVLRWAQRLAVRTLGRLETGFYRRLGDQFRPRRPEHARFWEHAEPADRDHGRTLDYLLEPAARCHDIDQEYALEFREHLAATYIQPATHRAFRALRKDAGEYIDEGDEDAVHNPSEQEHIAMRPALDELDGYQQSALRSLLKGFDERAEIIAWGEEIDLATHGEIPGDFVERCYKERVTAALFLMDDERARWMREMYAAVHLLPAFNAGVRDVVGRSGELPDTETDPMEATQA
jgi:hypothetical protein